MLYPEIVTDDTIHTCASIIKIVVGQNDQHSILSLLSLYEDCVTAEQLQRLHRVV
jgi:hypothetical protein